MADRLEPERPPDREYSVVGRTPGQKISRALLLIGLLVMLWVVYQVVRALG